MHSTPIKYLFILASFFLLSSTKCGGYYEPTVYTAYNPVFMKRADLEKSVTLEAARSLGKPAKIYTKGDYLFVSEAGVGVHIINNVNPSAPQTIGFVRVAGCYDMAIKNDILYVDNATDLVALDLSNPLQVKVTQRVVNAFPEPVPPDNLAIRPEHYKENRPADLVLVKWNKAQ
jgi:hypothetical protein